MPVPARNLLGQPLSNQDVEQAWSLYLDGDSATYIAGQLDSSPRTIRAVLADRMPAALADDPRLNGYRYSWEYASAAGQPGLSMAVYRHPMRIGTRDFNRGLKAMRRLMREAIPDLVMELRVGECFDTTREAYQAAERMIRGRGQPGFWMNAGGEVRRLVEEDFKAGPAGHAGVDSDADREVDKATQSLGQAGLSR